MNQNPIFVIIERCCKECVTQPNVESFKCLDKIINSASLDILEPIQKYIRFPLYHILNAPHLQTEAINIEICSCLISLCKKGVVIESFSEFAEVYIDLFVIIDDHLLLEQGRKASSEDLKNAAVNTVYEVLKCTPLSVLEECFDHDVFNRAIGNSIAILLRLIKEEKSKSLKTVAIRTLELIMSRAKEKVEVCDLEKVRRRSQLFSSFLPGITITFTNLITSDDKLPQLLITSSLEAFSLAIQLSLPHVPNQDSYLNQSSTEETAIKLKVALSRIVNELITRPSHRIKIALNNFTDEIFFNCASILVRQVADTIVDVPLTYSCDADVAVSEKGLSSISLVFKSCHILTTIQDVILDKLLQTCKLLRQNIDSLSSEQRLKHFKFLTGIFKSLKFQNSSFLHVPKNRNDIMRTLVHVSQFKRVSTLVDVTLNQDINPFQFQFLKSSHEVECFKELVKSVSSSCNKQMLVDFLICNLKETRFNEQFAFVSFEMLTDSSYDFPDDLFELVKLCIEEEVVKYPVITNRLRLALRGIDIWLSKSKNRDESQFLPIIYLILKIGPIELHLSQLSKKLDYKDESDMIYKHLSYFCNKFEEEMNTNHLTSTSVVLFRNLIHGSTKSYPNEAFVIFEKSIDTLLHILDLNYNKSPEIPLLLLSSFTESMSNVFSLDSSNKEHPDKRKSQHFCFRSSWSQYLQTVDVLETFTKDDKLDLEGTDGVKEDGNKSDHITDPEREDSSSDKKEVPVHVMIIKKILERSSNLLTLPEADHRSLILDVISNCVRILSQAENELLPLVHKMWSSLVNRLSDDVTIAHKAFNLILLLSSICGDFVNRRINSDIFPKILPFLRNNVTDGVKSRSRHPFTLVYRLQISALKGLGHLAVGTEAQGRSLWSVISVLIPYLSNNQPPALVDAAKESLLKLQSYEPDALWLYSKEYLSKNNVSNRDKVLIEQLNECSF